MNLDDAVKLLGAIAAVLAALAGCGWIGRSLYQMFFGGPERHANAAAALTGAAKLMVDELQEEVHGAREETRKARQETEELRTLLREMRRLADEEIVQLRAQVAVLKEQLHQLRRQSPQRDS